MENLINTLRIKPSGYGHFIISIEMMDQEIKATTTNTIAIDAIRNECYDYECHEDRFYENRQEAEEALINEILKKN